MNTNLNIAFLLNDPTTELFYLSTSVNLAHFNDSVITHSVMIEVRIKPKHVKNCLPSIYLNENIPPCWYTTEYRHNPLAFKLAVFAPNILLYVQTTQVWSHTTTIQDSKNKHSHHWNLQDDAGLIQTNVHNKYFLYYVDLAWFGYNISTIKIKPGSFYQIIKIEPMFIVQIQKTVEIVSTLYWFTVK